MTNNKSDNLIINKCLIVDDRFDEVKDLIFKLNEKAISTDYRKDVLGRDVFIDPNTQLVILDLYLAEEDQGSFESAIDTVEFFNDTIKGPYFLLVWTKHKDKFNEFKEMLQQGAISKNNDSDKIINFPLDIEILGFNKITGSQNEETVDNVIEYIYDYINKIEERYINIYSYMKLTKIFQEQSSMFWDILRPKNFVDDFTSDSFSTKYNDVLGTAFDTFDRAFNYEKSGKGFLSIHARFLESLLTVDGLNYRISDAVLEDDIKTEINSRLIVHEFNENKPKIGMPGLIYKVTNENSNILENLIKLFVDKDPNIEKSENEEAESVYLDSFKYKYFNLRALWTATGGDKKNSTMKN